MTTRRQAVDIGAELQLLYLSSLITIGDDAFWRITPIAASGVHLGRAPSLSTPPYFSVINAFFIFAAISQK